MTIAERTLKEYLSKYEEKKAELRKIEEEISILSRCRDWVNGNDAPSDNSDSGEQPEDCGKSDINPPENNKPELPIKKHGSAQRNAGNVSTEFNMQDIPTQKKGYIHEVVKGGYYSLGALLKGILVEAGISGNQLADDIGIPRTDIKSMILDRKIPYGKNQSRLAEALAIYTDIKGTSKRIEIACRRTDAIRRKEAANA